MTVSYADVVVYWVHWHEKDVIWREAYADLFFWYDEMSKYAESAYGFRRKPQLSQVLGLFETCAIFICIAYSVMSPFLPRFEGSTSTFVWHV